MKTFKIFFKTIAYLLTFLILLQGCTVYKTTPVTLKYASEVGTPVRIQKPDGKKMKLIKVEKLKDGKYYGDKNVHGTAKQILLNEDDIIKVELKDKKKSIFNSIAAPIILIGIIVFVSSRIKKNISVGSVF